MSDEENDQEYYDEDEETTGLGYDDPFNVEAMDDLYIAKSKSQASSVGPFDTSSISTNDMDRYMKNCPKGVSSIGTRRLLDELMYFKRLNVGINGDEYDIHEDNIYHWIIKLRDFPKDSKLWADIMKAYKPYIELEILFPGDYPFSPPFIRVVEPRFQFMTGHITSGGSICMEVLTKSGWVPSYSLENLLMQIKAEMVDGGARLDLQNRTRYTIGEAKEAYERMKSKHGWN
jgi:ubiquitin-conjugating enzyme E2 Q